MRQLPFVRRKDIIFAVASFFSVEAACLNWRMVLVSVTWFSARAQNKVSVRRPLRRVSRQACLIHRRPSVPPLCIYLEAVEAAGGHNERSPLTEAIVFFFLSSFIVIILSFLIMSIVTFFGIYLHSAFILNSFYNVILCCCAVHCCRVGMQLLH